VAAQNAPETIRAAIGSYPTPYLNITFTEEERANALALDKEAGDYELWEYAAGGLNSIGPGYVAAGIGLYGLNMATVGTGSLVVDAAEGTTTLYRAVSGAEMADVAATGGFRGGGLTQMETKLFATSEGDVGFFAKDVLNKLSGQQSWVLKVEIPNSLAGKLFTFTADGRATVAVYPELLEEFNAGATITPLPYVPVPGP
jgi:hypothetical protein